MAAYAISEVEILDEAQAERYGELAAASIAKYGGRYLVRGARPQVPEGEWPLDERVVIVEFPTLERLREWYASPEYAEALEISQTALARRLLFVEGEDVSRPRPLGTNERRRGGRIGRREGNITDTTHHPDAAAAPGPADRSAAPGGDTPALRIAAVAFLAAAAATAVCGIPAGLAWGALAPRALVQIVGPGAVQIVNPETSAFIVADVWFCLIGVIGGLLTGALGYLIAVRRWGAAAAAGLIAGALAATALELWIGGLDGHAAFQHRLAVGAPGTVLHAFAGARGHQRPHLLADGDRAGHRRAEDHPPVAVHLRTPGPAARPRAS